MPENIPANEITFREMSEEQAVKTFEDDRYFDYQKRAMRYGKKLPSDSIWATSPAKMFVAFYKEKPVGVIGYSTYRKYLLGAGIHVRKEYRGKGISDILIKKIIKEKGNKTLLVNIGNMGISSTYRKNGFKDMEIESLPEELKQEALLRQKAQPLDQVQKWMMMKPSKWMEVLKWN